jgi:hypothetical protein
MRERPGMDDGIASPRSVEDGLRIAKVGAIRDIERLNGPTRRFERGSGGASNPS